MDFINKDTMCYKCGNNVKFMGVNGAESVYPTNGMRSFAAHGINKVFAIADISLPPVISIVKYPDLQTVSQLTGKSMYLEKCRVFTLYISGKPFDIGLHFEIVNLTHI